MKDEDFQGIVAGLKDAIAFVQGDSTRGRVAAGPDVEAIRAKTKLSQAKFADKLRVPVGTVRDWEQHAARPTPRRGRCWGWWMWTRRWHWR